MPSSKRVRVSSPYKSGHTYKFVERTTYVFEKTSPPPPGEGKVIERRTEIIREGSPASEIPRSVREWDQMSMSTKKSHKKSRRESSSSSEDTMSHHSRHRRARSHSAAGTKREIFLTEERDESATIRAGIGALVIPERQRRGSRNIQREIKALEAEKRLLQLEREENDLRGEGRSGEIIIARERNDTVEVRKDKKGRMSLVVH